MNFEIIIKCLINVINHPKCTKFITPFLELNLKAPPKKSIKYLIVQFQIVIFYPSFADQIQNLTNYIYQRQQNIMENKRRRLPTSPIDSIKSSRSTSNKKDFPKIKMPKNSKLEVFFNLPYHKNNLVIQGKSNNLFHPVQRLRKAVSLKSMRDSLLGRKTLQSQKVQIQSKDIYQKEEVLSFEKDPSQTRSRLTIMQQYGIEPDSKKNRNKNLQLKVPKSIRSKSGKKNVIFPLKASALKNQKCSKKKNYKSVANLQYTFGINGTGFKGLKK